MAKLSILAGATGQSVNVFIQDTSKTNGSGLTGLVFNSSGLIGYYTFAGTNTTATSITLATLAAVNSSYSSGGFKEIDATHMPGVYRFDIPNATLAAASGRSVLIMLSGSANMAPVLVEIELTAVDNQSTSYGLTLTSSSFAGGAITTTTFAAGAITAAVTDSTFDNAIATSVFTNNLTEAYASLNGSLTVAKALYGITQQMGSMSITGTTMTVTKRDNATTAKTYTLNSASTPTTITEAS